jgi:hypothetical protein
MPGSDIPLGGLWKEWFANMGLGVMDEIQLTKRKTGKVLPMSPV